MYNPKSYLPFSAFSGNSGCPTFAGNEWTNKCHMKSFFFLFLIYLSCLRNLETDNRPELDCHWGAYINIPLALGASSLLHLRDENQNSFTFIYIQLLAQRALKARCSSLAWVWYKNHYCTDWPVFLSLFLSTCMTVVKRLYFLLRH